MFSVTSVLGNILHIRAWTSALPGMVSKGNARSLGEATGQLKIYALCFFSYNDLRQIHIGELIRQQLVAQGMSFAEFARQLNVERTTVYNIFRSKSIDIERLIRISVILDYDFIAEVYQQHEPTPRTCRLFIPPELNIQHPYIDILLPK